MPTLDAYATLPDLRATLQRAGTPAPEADLDLTRWLNTGKTEIEQWCRRVFAPVSSTITLDAPVSPWLRVPDLLTVTTLTAYGTDLVAGTDYRLVTDDLTDPYRLRPWAPHYTRIARLIAGAPGNWAADTTGNWGQITLVCQEGYAATVPDAIVLANLRIAARGWQGRLMLYGDSDATDGQPAQTTEQGWIAGDPDLVRLLAPYRVGAAQ